MFCESLEIEKTNLLKYQFGMLSSFEGLFLIQIWKSDLLIQEKLEFYSFKKKIENKGKNQEIGKTTRTSNHQKENIQNLSHNSDFKFNLFKNDRFDKSKPLPL